VSQASRPALRIVGATPSTACPSLKVRCKLSQRFHAAKTYNKADDISARRPKTGRLRPDQDGRIDRAATRSIDAIGAMMTIDTPSPPTVQ
jgi:hypothetical protein